MWAGSIQHGFVLTSLSRLRERLSVTRGALHGVEVSSLNFIKVSLCLSHELTECKRFSGATRVLSERASFLNVVDVTVVASRALIVSPFSLHLLGLGRIQQLSFLVRIPRMNMGNFQFGVLTLPCFFDWSHPRHKYVVSVKCSDPGVCGSSFCPNSTE